jgi:diaminohydroxyphosphoribosylaminopyrimidine deaminase / 5-amino-6-(5-phosphoribosylamino)uracil reductase
VAEAERLHMLTAIDLAAGHRTHPNPRVGAVVVSPTGEVVGSGAHLARGGPHAEAHAFEEAGEAARGGTLIVTLEPCAHEGATPPCVDGVIASGVKRVVVAMEDPDPRVAGRGIAALRSAGVDVVVGVAASEAEALDPGYFHHRRTGRPRVTLKMAATLDGQAAAANGTSQWITSEPARADVHRMRAEADAVAVGAGTVLADDPRLTVRLAEATTQPVPVLFVGRRPIPPEAAVLTRPSIVYSPQPIDLPNAEVVVMPGHQGVDLGSALDDLGRRGIVDLLVEGGPRLAGALLGLGLVDRVVWYIGAGLAGGVGLPAVAGTLADMGSIHSLTVVSVGLVGPDIRVEATMRAA